MNALFLITSSSRFIAVNIIICRSQIKFSRGLLDAFFDLRTF